MVAAARKLVAFSKRDPIAMPFTPDEIESMAAGCLVVGEVAVASLEAMKRMIDGEGFLWNDSPLLDSTDALFLESWTFLGRLLRYQSAEGEVKRWTVEARRMVEGIRLVVSDKEPESEAR